MKWGRKRAFAQNTLIMTVTSLITKLMGLYLNVYLARYLKAEGLGLYGLVMSVYVFASGFSVSGMSVAVSRISSQELAKNDESTSRGVLRRCMCISVVLSLFAAVMMVSLSGVIAKHWIKDEGTVNSLCTASLALPLISISAMFRGWYTAMRKVLMPSLSQLFEQIVRLCSCIVIIPRLAKDTASGCFSVVLCDLLAEFAGCAFITVFYLFSKKAKHKTPQMIGRRISDNAVPITVSHYLSSTLRTVESMLIPTCLICYGLSRGKALSQIGMIHSMALPLLFFPSSLLTAAGSLLTPEIVRYKSLNENRKVREIVEKSIGLTILCAVPIATLFLLFAKEISMTLYGERGLIGILSVLAPLVPMMYCETICTGLLRGLGEQKCLLKYSAADGIMRLILILVLVPQLGLSGLLATMIISNIFTPVMCALRLRKVTGAEGFVRSAIVSLACGAVSGIITVLCKKAISGIPDMAVAIICGAVFVAVYILLILCSRRKPEEAARRVCLRIPKAVRYISCRQDSSGAQAEHRVQHSR